MSAPVVSLSHVSFSYPGKSAVFIDLSIEVGRGEHVFIVGPSGSGKTTLLNLIGGVILPDTGEVKLLGRSLRSIRSSARDTFRADSLGIIFQQFNLVPYLSVIENILLPLQFSSKRRERIKGSPENEAIGLLEGLGLNDELLFRSSCSSLSVGQQQRVAAARALIGSPEVIIADEPTSALDHDRREEFLDLLFKQCRESGTTLLFVSHDRTLRDRFDRVISLTESS